MRERIFWIGLTIALAGFVIAGQTLQAPPGAGGSAPLWDRLDYWLYRYQPLACTLIAVVAGLAAWTSALDHLSRRREATEAADRTAHEEERRHGLDQRAGLAAARQFVDTVGKYLLAGRQAASDKTEMQWIVQADKIAHDCHEKMDSEDHVRALETAFALAPPEVALGVRGLAHDIDSVLRKTRLLVSRGTAGAIEIQITEAEAATVYRRHAEIVALLQRLMQDHRDGAMPPTGAQKP